MCPLNNCNRERYKGLAMRIKIIVPAATDEFNQGIKEEADTVKAPDCSIDIENPNTGPSSIESRYDAFLAGLTYYRPEEFPDNFDKTKKIE
jgi:hypothetical protein